MGGRGVERERDTQKERHTKRDTHKRDLKCVGGPDVGCEADAYEQDPRTVVAQIVFQWSPYIPCFRVLGLGFSVWGFGVWGLGG